MKARLLLTLSILLIALLGIAFAQDFNPCFSLSEEDCALVAEANLNTATQLADVDSFSIDLEVSIAVENIPDSDPFSFEMAGTIDLIKNEDAQVGANAYGMFDVAADVEGEDMEATLEFWIVDDVFYFISPEDEGLYSIDLVRLMEETDMSFDMEDATDPAGELGGGMLDEDGMEAISELLTLPGLLDWVRDGDDFVFTIDLGVLVDPQNAEALEDIVDAVGEANPEFGEQLEAYLPMMSMMLEEGTITFTQGLNTELNIIDAYSLEMNLAIPSVMMGGEATDDSTTIDFLFGMTLGNYDGAESPEAPEGAEDITDDVIDGLEGTMGGGDD
jgi:hypothetical protein